MALRFVQGVQDTAEHGDNGAAGNDNSRQLVNAPEMTVRGRPSHCLHHAVLALVHCMDHVFQTTLDTFGVDYML